MDIYYSLIKAFSKNEENMERAKQKAEELLDSSFVEKSEIVELAKETNTVLLVEEEADDGGMEFVVINNQGRVIIHEIFSLDKSYEARDEVERVGAENYFTKTMLKEIDKFAAEYEMSREDFIEEYLSTYYMDVYENKKSKYIENIENYFKE